MLFRNRLSLLSRRWRNLHSNRLYTTPPKSPAKDPNAIKQASDAAQTTPNPSIERMHGRLPRFLRPYTEGLRNAPVSHITSFLILHELTAILPLFGLGAYFYYAETMPWFAEGKFFNDGVQKFGNYFRKKGWLGEDSKLGEDGQKVSASKRWTWWGRGENSLKMVTSFAAAYTLTKMLLPARLVFSVWLTPLFARKTLVPITRSLKKLLKRNKPAAP